MTASEIDTLPGYEEFAPWLLVEKTGNAHVVAINRPEAFNAVNEEVHHAFATIWRTLAADDDVKVVVTTGVGKAFSAGGDMVMFGRLIEDPVARQFQIAEARTVFWRSSTSASPWCPRSTVRRWGWAARLPC
jgi:enoyl-CoA hydratase/carnithine racemase